MADAAGNPKSKLKAVKRKRIVLTIADKLEILDLIDESVFLYNHL